MKQLASQAQSLLTIVEEIRKARNLVSDAVKRNDRNEELYTRFKSIRDQLNAQAEALEDMVLKD